MIDKDEELIEGKGDSDEINVSSDDQEPIFSEVNFPHPIGEKYYVVDAGYPNTRGYLAPDKGTSICYHIPDFRRGIDGDTSTQRRIDDLYMSVVRDMIAGDLIKPR